MGAAARYLMRHPMFAAVAAHLAEMDWIFLTGISLAVLPAEDRLSLIALLHRLARAGTAIAFDTNYRPGLWADRNDARETLRTLMPAVRVAMTSIEDERLLWDVEDPQSTITRLREAGVHSVVVKMGAQGVMFNEGDAIGRVASFPVPCPADTTAAGDSFDAAYLAGILSALPVEECCSMGNALAAIVVGHRGAVIPFDAIPALEDLRNLARGSAGPRQYNLA